MKLLEGKVALITGGTRGIGKGIVEVFATQGAKVAFTYAGSVEKAQELEKSLSSVTQIKGYQSDASDYDAAQKLVEDVVAEFGKIDILVNNAGITKDNLFPWVTEEDWDAVLNTSLKGMYNCTQAIIQRMLRQRSGRIINIASLSGLKGVPGQTNYSAAKGGMIAATKALSQEIAKRNITVNAIAPGFIESDMTSDLDMNELKRMVPANRFGKVEEVAYLASFLASEKAAYITGEVININGGIYA